MRLLKILVFLFVVFPYFIFSQVSIDEFPEELQLFKRDVASNTATVHISGEVDFFSSVSTVTLDIYQDDVLIESIPYPLVFDNGPASFEFSTNITAGLINYTFKLKSNTGQIIREASDVVAGDVYVINGQSNAIRNTYANAPFPYQSNFIRTFLGETQTWSTDPNPFIFGGIGYWFAHLIVENQNIPVLILNGGEGGKAISHFPRNDTSIYDLETNYGRLLTRYNQAHFSPGDVRGFVWFQGESDAFTSVANYTSAFNNLYEAWEEDYAPDQYYIFQVRYGCTIAGYPDYRKDFQTPEANRQLGLLPKSRIISTNAITKGDDNCHYYGTGGYVQLAERLYGVAAFDLYNSANSGGIFSPTVDNVHFTNESRNQIRFELLPASDLYTWQNGVENDFWIEGMNDISITDGCVSENIVTLNLSAEIIEENPKLSYLGHNPNDTPFIVNQNGIGMLSFKDVPISETVLGNREVSVSSFSMYPNPATETIQIQWGLAHSTKVIVYDITGKMVYERESSNDAQIAIDVSTWSSGQYFVKVINQCSTSVKKLLVD